MKSQPTISKPPAALSWKNAGTACQNITSHLGDIVLPGRRLSVLWVFDYKMPHKWHVTRHQHSYYEMNLILSGHARDSRQPNQRLGPGHVFIHGPNQHHQWSSPWGLCRRLVICFNAEPSVPMTVPDQWPCWDYLLPIAQQMLQLADKMQQGWEDRVHARLALLLSEALTLGELDTPLPAANCQGEDHIIQRVDTFLDDNYAQPIRLQDVAAHVGVSLSTLTHHYPKLSGQTVGQRLITLRMEQAAYLLRETDHSLQKIAEAVGVREAAYFCRQFKKHFRTTPGSYRAMQLPD